MRRTSINNYSHITTQISISIRFRWIKLVSCLSDQPSISSTQNARVFRTNVRFSSFFQLHEHSKSCQNVRSYEKRATSTLMKLTPGVSSINICYLLQQVHVLVVIHYFLYMTQSRGGQLFSSTGHIAPLLVSRGPHFSQKGKVKAKKLAFAGRMWPAGRMLPPSLLRAQSAKVQLLKYYKFCKPTGTIYSQKWLVKKKLNKEDIKTLCTLVDEQAIGVKDSF